MSGYPWFKIDTEGWLQGTVRARGTTAEQRGVFIDLIALASSTRLRDGTLRFAVDSPMDRLWIANTLRIPLPVLNATIEAGQEDKNTRDGRHRIEVWEDGTIELTNFERYQAVPEGKKKVVESPVERDLRLARECSKLTKRFPEVAQQALSELKGD